jgi:hypothetical protein
VKEKITDFFKVLMRQKGAGWIALIVIISTLGEVHHFFRSRERSIHAPRFLKAKRSISPGEQFNFRDFTFSIDEPDEPIENFVTDQELQTVERKTFQRELPEGLLLRKALLTGGDRSFPRGIPRGSVAYSFKPSNWLPVRREDRIDVLVKTTEGQSKVLTLLESAPVLGTKDMSREVVIAALRTDIELLENAKDHGTLMIALRSPEDSLPSHIKIQKPDFRRRPRQKRVEVVTEGE